jgi:hypothetical protein
MHKFQKLFETEPEESRRDRWRRRFGDIAVWITISYSLWVIFRY